MGRLLSVFIASALLAFSLVATELRLNKNGEINLVKEPATLIDKLKNQKSKNGDFTLPMSVRSYSVLPLSSLVVNPSDLIVDLKPFVGQELYILFNDIQDDPFAISSENRGLSPKPSGR